MPSFNNLLAFSLATIGALAAPARDFIPRDKDYSNNTSPSSYHSSNNHHSQKADELLCLTSHQAQAIATDYGLLISNYTDTLADSLLMPNFTDYSQSVNTLINSCPQGSEAHTLPLSAPTFTSLEKFKAGQSQQPPINFEQLAIFPACTSVTIRWQTTNTVNATDLLPTAKEGVRPVVGLITIEAIPAAESKEIGWKVHTVYSEFDSGAWLQNLRDADICGNPEKNLGAPDANPNSNTNADAASVGGAETSGAGATPATSRPVKRARMYV
ncbi:hypothetical protein CKM354_000880200 [Cercospora kikuchii]|uniref:NTF2-like domain-containing protein n=1 Tax=Cercospora kikuchii TaxID=84275 RepID=A0A9P3FJM5_9PEZI|nr:uncharacterized protein CKM354_000880200 [Cercospora kikuchii]GIZ45644.1 hypothetical protein CKM354_000880200 [Cercospora kikuchii]